MANVLVIFESKYGQSAKIAEHVATLARKRGHSAEVLSIDLAEARGIRDEGAEDHDAFVIVAPVYMGHHPRAIESFVRRHADRLSSPRTRCAFISVSGSAADTRPSGKGQERAHRYVDDFLKTTGLRPNFFITTAGSIAYPRYGRLVRAMMWLIHRKQANERTKIHELTDWRSLDNVMVPFFNEGWEQGEQPKSTSEKSPPPTTLPIPIPIHGPAHCESSDHLRMSFDKSGIHRVRPVTLNEAIEQSSP